MTKNREAHYLRLTYYGRDEQRKFKILINEQLIANVSLDGTKGDKFYEVDYQIPEQMLKTQSSKLTVKFVADDGGETAKVYEVRLMRK